MFGFLKAIVTYELIIINKLFAVRYLLYLRKNKYKRMKRILLSLGLAVTAQIGFAQITITSSDMPVVNDTLRWSSVLPIGTGFNVYDTGANHTWDYSALGPNAQGIDDYQSAVAVNILWTLINPSAYGYKVLDSIPTGGVLSVHDIYTFYMKNGTASYNAVGFGATISGFPLPAVYSAPDTIYDFPLAYGNTADTSTFFVNDSIPSIGAWIQSGTRYTTVDGWGTIKTPYYSTAVNCIRVRSEVLQTDSVYLSSLSFGIKLPVHTVDYKFLVNGDHYPALWVTTTITGSTETVSSVRFKDIYRDSLHPNSVNNVTSALTLLKAYPNPAIDGRIYLDVPTSWNYFTVDIYDMLGKLVNSSKNNRELNLQDLAAGEYLGRISSGDKTGLVRITK
jgi:hypothetical protein